MRTTLTALLFSASLLLAPLWGCSEDTAADPLGDKCRATCKIDDTHPCFTKMQECVDKCRQLAGSIEKNSLYIDGCAECVAGQFKYAVKTDPPCSATSTDPTCCYEGTVIQPKPEDPECAILCFEADGGPAF